MGLNIILRNILLLALGALCFHGCALDIGKLAGAWQAVAFYENGQRVATNLDSVSLQLAAEGQYIFRSQGFYTECGPYRVSRQFLYMTDTTRQPAEERIVKVLYLSGDSLKIRMNAAGKEQVLFLARQK